MGTARKKGRAKDNCRSRASNVDGGCHSLSWGRLGEDNTQRREPRVLFKIQETFKGRCHINNSSRRYMWK